MISGPGNEIFLMSHLTPWENEDILSYAKLPQNILKTELMKLTEHWKDPSVTGMATANLDYDLAWGIPKWNLFYDLFINGRK